MALAVAGGVLPSPTALIVLLVSVAFHRVAYGLGLIAAFSVGLATALIVVGILALRARDLVSRRMSGNVGRLVPVFSASAIVLLGLVLTVRGFVQLLGVTRRARSANCGPRPRWARRDATPRALP